MSLGLDKDNKDLDKIAVVVEETIKNVMVWPKATIEFTCGKCGFVTNTLNARDCENCSHLVRKNQHEDFRSRIPTFFGQLDKQIGRATASSTTIRRRDRDREGEIHELNRRIHFDHFDALLDDDDDDDFEDLSSNESSQTLLAAATNADNARARAFLGSIHGSSVDQGHSTSTGEGFDWEFPQPSDRSSSISSTAPNRQQGYGRGGTSTNISRSRTGGGPSSSFGRGRGRPRILTPRPGPTSRNYRDARIFSTDEDYELFTPSEEELMRLLDVD